MHLLYKKAKAKGVRIDRADLVAQGKHVELFPGVEGWFDEIAGYVKLRAETHGITLRHYLVSAGLTEIIEGTRIYKRFHNVFASEYWFEAYEVPFPKRVITDTGKTQYLFRINKGIENLGDSINQHMPEAARPIPFANMIYFGDGDTDVPSMAVMRKNGGHAVAVHPAGQGAQEVRGTVQGRALRFLRPRRLSPRLGAVQAHVPPVGPHAGRHPRAGGDVAAGAGGALARAHVSCDLRVHSGPEFPSSRRWHSRAPKARCR